MPWRVEHNPSRCTPSKPWAVVKETDQSVEGCHASKEEANDHMKALYASEDE